MKKLAVWALLALQLGLGGCGSSSSTTTAAATSSGLWSATLAGGSGDANGAVLSFITKFTVGGDGSLSISEFSFNTASTSGGCFGTQTESGTSSLTTDSAGTVTGTISLIVTSTSPAGNTLTLMGNETSASSITGSWTVAGGANCSAGGTFTMTKSAT